MGGRVQIADTKAETQQSFVRSNALAGATVVTDQHAGNVHNMSAKHLHRYVNEFSFRRNTVQNGTMRFIQATVGRMICKRLTYRGLVYG
jgi:hypothetical protein